MKGQILDFSIQNGGGLINGEDGKRYPFKSEEWKEQNIPTRGMNVDFDINGDGQAIGIYKALNSSSSNNVVNAFNTVAQSRNENGQLSLFALFLETLSKRYAQFSGRASKREFWGYTLFRIIADFSIFIVAIIMSEISRSLGDIFFLLYYLFVLAVIIPSLSVAIRRLHDIGKSGWWFLITLIPIIGPIWLIVLMCQPSFNGDNQWGSMPEN